MRRIMLGAAIVAMGGGTAQAAVIFAPAASKPAPSASLELKKGLPIILVPSGQPTPMPAQISAVPEPSTWALLATGFGLAGLGLRRRRIAPTAA